MITTTATRTATAHECTYKEYRGAGSLAKRRILATVLHLASLTGNSDGATWADCVGCGERATVGGNPRAMDTFNLGHVLADAEGGTYCPCNLLPLCRQCNADMGKETLTDVLVPTYDNRTEWDGELIKDMGMVKEEAHANRGRARWNRPA